MSLCPSLRRKRLPGFGKGVTVYKLISIFLAELLGTGILLYLGCMSVVSGSEPLTVSLVFGFAAATTIQSISAVSDGHINPAVSVAAVVLGKITAPLCLFYIAAQVCGGLLGYSLLMLVTPEAMRQTRTCCTIPVEELNTVQAVACEFIATAILVFLFCGCCDRRNIDKQDSTSLKIGFAVALLVAAVGPYTGGSMNPVRSLAPAVYHHEWTLLWIYPAGQMAAALLVPIFYRLFFVQFQSIKKPSLDKVRNNKRNSSATSVGSKSGSRQSALHIGYEVNGVPGRSRVDDRTTDDPGPIPGNPEERRAALERVLRDALSSRQPNNPHN